MGERSAEVDAFVAALDHPFKAEIMELRLAILDSNADIDEHIKWNAPSFLYGGEDRVTFRLQPGRTFQVILHRGAKVRADTQDFTFEDHSGLLVWVATDRGVVRFPSPRSAANQRKDVVALVNRWVLA